MPFIGWLVLVVVYLLAVVSIVCFMNICKCQPPKPEEDHDGD